MDISCAFATSIATPDHVVLAERLGYRRAWLYDSSGLYPDVWAMLALCAQRTDRIGLGPGVLVPSLRHPMTNAAAIATLCAMAPGRVEVAVGSGFTGRYVMGKRPMRWSDVAAYVRTVRALLRGEDAVWEGAVVRMLHPDGFVAPRPVDVPILIGAGGPKGLAVAAEVGDGVFSAVLPTPGVTGRHALLQMGTVLDDGEDPASERVLHAAGHAAVVAYHAVYERNPDAVDQMPGGRVWREAIEAVPEAERHLAIHEGHLVAPNARDLAALRAAPEVVSMFTLTATPEDVRARLGLLAAQGVTEVAYQPAGDIARELEAFAAATIR